MATIVNSAPNVRTKTNGAEAAYLKLLYVRAAEIDDVQQGVVVV